MTQRELESLSHGTLVRWTRHGEESNGRVFHDITYSYILWDDGQQTYSADDAALRYVRGNKCR